MPWGTFGPTFWCHWVPVRNSLGRNPRILHFLSTGSASALKRLHFIKQSAPAHKPGGHSSKELLLNLEGPPPCFRHRASETP